MPVVEPGLVAEVTLTVTAADTAVALRSGDVEALATPRVVALVEQAAVAAVAGALAPHQTTVGSWIELAHLAPTRVAATVVARATLESVDGRRLTFAVSVTEHGTEVARGRHRRAIVDRAAFG